MSPKQTVMPFMYIQPLVLAIYQHIARQRSIVKAPARVVEAPILANSIRRVSLALHCVVPSASASRRYFQHEVRRFANLAYYIAIARDYAFRIDTESHYTVGSEPLGIVCSFMAQVTLARNQHIVSVSKVRYQCGGKGYDPLELFHIMFPLRIRQRFQMRVVCNLRSEGTSSGHSLPLCRTMKSNSHVCENTVYPKTATLH